MSQTITIPTEGGEFSAYVAQPTKLPAPVVVVLHEIFGVNEDIRQTSRELANKGFIAIAPELFLRQERGVLTLGRTKSGRRVWPSTPPTIETPACEMLSRRYALQNSFKARLARLA